MFFLRQLWFLCPLWAFLPHRTPFITPLADFNYTGACLTTATVTGALFYGVHSLWPPSPSEEDGVKCEQNRNEQCVRDLCSRAVSLNTADTPSTPLQSKHFFKKPFSWIITCLSVCPTGPALRLSLLLKMTMQKQ